MTRKKYLLMGFWMSLFVALSACSEFDLSGEPEQRKDNAQFYQHWVNSFEEQTGVVQVFRPAGSREFPTSRFRMEYVFNADGSCQYKALSPMDAHSMKHCVFTKVGNKVYVYDDAGVLIQDLSFTLVSPPEKDMMRLTKGVKKPVDKKAAGTEKASAKKDH